MSSRKNSGTDPEKKQQKSETSAKRPAKKTVTPSKTVKIEAASAKTGPALVADGNAFARKKAQPAAAAPEFHSDLALDIMGELYPLLLENCTDADDEIDTQAVFEVLAGLIGLFTAEYHENYGPQKAATAFQDLVSLALATYQQRLADSQV